MAPDPVECKLAVVLSADVVGYSRLMAQDEAATVRTLTTCQQQVTTLVHEDRGCVVQSLGKRLVADLLIATDDLPVRSRSGGGSELATPESAR